MGNGHRRPGLHFNHSSLECSITASLKQSPGPVSLSHLMYQDNEAQANLGLTTLPRLFPLEGSGQGRRKQGPRRRDLTQVDFPTRKEVGKKEGELQTEKLPWGHKGLI